MRRTAVLIVLVAAVATGCRPTPHSPPLPETAPPHAAEPSPVLITPAARVALREAAADFAEGNRWWVRLTAKPGGCTGFQSKLDLDSLGVQAGDREAECDGVRILYLDDQEFIVQGAVIDFVHTAKERGFKVDYPNRTEENRRRTAEWVEKQTAVRVGGGD